MEMACIVVDRVGSFGVERRPRPQPGPGEILVRVEWAGLCRTDLKLIREGHRDLTLPRIPGEETVGVLAETGAGVIGLQAGQRVYLYPGIWCGSCPACVAGAENLCRQMRIMGFHRDGGFAEYVAVPAQSAIVVPEGLPADQAVFAEPLSCCLNALEIGGAGPGKRVGIWGAGPAGTLLHRAARALGGEPVNIEPDQRRRERIGGIVEPGSSRFDVAIVAVGSTDAYRRAVAALSPRGRLVVFSGLGPAEGTAAVDFNTLHYLEQGIVGAYGCTWRQGREALSLIAAGKVAVADLVSHRLPLAALDEGLDLVARREGMKILLKP